jgi:hypothetical protein
MKLLPVLAVLFLSVMVLGCVSAPDGKATGTTLQKDAVNGGSNPQAAKGTPDKVGVDTSKPPAPKNALEGCAAIDDKRMMNICLRDSAVKSGDSSSCGAIDSEGLRDECYYKIAINTRSAGLCAKVGNADMKTVCQGKLS